MNSDLVSLLVQYEDVGRDLAYILKNAAYDQRCGQVATAHYKDMLTAIASCRRLLDEVLVKQRKACE